MARKSTTDEPGNGEKAAKLLNISVPPKMTEAVARAVIDQWLPVTP